MKPQDMKDLRELIEFLKQYQVAEFDLDRGDIKIRLKFAQAAPSPGIADLARLASASAAATLPAGACRSGIGGTCTASGSRRRPAHRQISHRRNATTARPRQEPLPFVSPGDRVEKGQVICIVEAMKLMNEIESDAAGEVVKCYISNGQPIEFGQPLFSIRPMNRERS